MTIGERIRDLRRKSDMTQEKLADYLGVSYQAVSKWENGISSPDLALIIPLAKLFSVTTDELLGMNSAESDARKAELETEWKKTYNTGDLTKRYEAASSADELWQSKKVHTYTAPFFDHLECDPKSFCVSGMSTEVDDMRSELEFHDFDPVRDRLTFMD